MPNPTHHPVQLIHHVKLIHHLQLITPSNSFTPSTLQIFLSSNPATYPLDHSSTRKNLKSRKNQLNVC